MCILTKGLLKLKRLSSQLSNDNSNDDDNYLFSINLTRENTL